MDASPIWPAKSDAWPAKPDAWPAKPDAVSAAVCWSKDARPEEANTRSHNCSLFVRVKLQRCISQLPQVSKSWSGELEQGLGSKLMRLTVLFPISWIFFVRMEQSSRPSSQTNWLEFRAITVPGAKLQAALIYLFVPTFPTPARLIAHKEGSTACAGKTLITGH
eukprot:1161333-Pelagomonas_calceolata.AAC.9